MSKKLPPPREITPTPKAEVDIRTPAEELAESIRPKAEVDIRTPAEELAESIREEVAENVSVTVAGPNEKSEKKRRALIIKALGDISAKKLREILAERLTLDEALKLAEIE